MDRIRSTAAAAAVALTALGWVGAPSALAAGNADAAKACQQDGYLTVVRADGSPFVNVGACVSYAARGGVLARDADGDHVVDSIDNCPAVPNATQLDNDADGVGDACDLADPPPPVDPGGGDGGGDAPTGP